MMTVIRGDKGQLEAVCEWWTVNQRNERVPHGSWVWVNQLEIGKGLDGRKLIDDVIAEIAFYAPEAVGAYWQRRDKSGPRLHYFLRNRLVPQPREEVTG